MSHLLNNQFNKCVFIPCSPIILNIDLLALDTAVRNQTRDMTNL